MGISDKSQLVHNIARAKRVQRAITQDWDMIIVGGGIHGMALAVLSSQMGYKTFLLEQNDYASATSSRSSKMAHGGLRYLEMFDFQQVFEGIACREELFAKAPHLVRPEKFLIPVYKGDWWFRLKLHIGLWLYDRMVKSPERRHRWIPEADLDPDLFGQAHQKLKGAFEYTDGLMKDARLVFELLVAAEHHGCCALNYAEFVRKDQDEESGRTRVQWRDNLTAETYSSTTSVVFNCAGPWAPHIQESNEKGNGYPVKYSRGSHLIFSKPWNFPSLFLPLSEKGRYYFVWPHVRGTMVGTTEREVKVLDNDPVPSRDEEQEILERLQKDLPHHELTADCLVSSFAGIRILPLRDRTKRVGALSRKHIWDVRKQMFSLIGGKYTSFAWTVREGMKLFLQSIGAALKNIPSSIENLPGYIADSERASLIKTLHEQHPAHKKAVSRAVERLGSQVLRYSDRAEAWEEICPGVLMLEVLHAIECEHACSLEGVVRWRLELESTSDCSSEEVFKKIAKMIEG